MSEMISKEQFLNMDKRFPAEFERHKGTLMIWPVRPGSWGIDRSTAEKAFTDIFKELLAVEELYVAVNPGSLEEVEKSLKGYGINPEEERKLHLLELETDDSWARDTGPTFVKLGDKRVGISWSFNAWGGSFDGLYADWEADDRLAGAFCKKTEDVWTRLDPFVLEGGSIHSDGQGTLMVTESCLLSEGRNPSMTKLEIEDMLKASLGIRKVLWLPRGIYMDETNEHVDNVCAFVKPGEVVLAWTDDENDPQYELSRLDYEYLSHETDACGRNLKITKLPIPDIPVCYTAEELGNMVFEEGEDEREEGERLAASYANFYFANELILLPQFGGENEASDRRALEIMKKTCPDRTVVPISARAIILGGGNIHCITQQIPE